jgi:hypothetical protein
MLSGAFTMVLVMFILDCALKMHNGRELQKMKGDAGMKKKVITFTGIVVMCILVSAGVFAEDIEKQELTVEKQELTVEDAAVATGVEDLAPVGAAVSFTSDVGKLYAFSRIVGAQGEAYVKHLWYYGDDLMAEIRLRVNSSNWRTYSSKNILPEWAGEWKLVIATEDGEEIHSVPFTIE